ncbi:TIGR03564 family F420-dependent LLM class oxidoreductase [Nocardia gipuzkoensis]|uniref:TIGR03564 family F420-dependent LLM class oxidoreductase n=1 Tax=Nocardia gipuzkoensis TaxID=2749991 RepID=UPI00237ECE8B|nr:TIGR03564 family F420-dependent LLM class oxidoreductase [Nocardia gipuzkoensis]MDE1675267.1 TIGR03564 family F420-dependent LLM class oxidoreductase [Nocardia gipuzkoensis]
MLPKVLQLSQKSELHGSWQVITISVTPGMKIGLFVQEATVDMVVDRISQAHRIGFARAWVSQILGVDAMTALAVTAREVPGIGLGTSVVPTYPRHPMALAAQARTVGQISGGRFTLGIGLSHRVLIEKMLGMKWGEIRHLSEYLEILVPLLNGERANFAGETLTGKVGLEIATNPVPLVVAALGPKMLNIAGRLTDGTTTWMTGLETLRKHVVPSIRAGAAEVGRAEPAVIAALPVAVTDESDMARAAAAKVFALYERMPSYRAMLDREGAGGAADIAIVGDESAVAEQIRRFGDAGVTEFVVFPYFERERTLELVGSLINVAAGRSNVTEPGG